jgi:hypothetical protein
MRKLLPLAGLLVSASGLMSTPAATAQIYRCESADGTPLYQNSPGKNCKALDLPSLTTVPAVRTPAARTASAASAAPADFPKVDPAAQRGRDSDRRKILQDELEREQARLEEFRKEYNGGEPERLGSERNYQKYLDRVERLKSDIARAESNVASLRRELDSVR